MTTTYVDRTLFHISGSKIGTITDVIHRPNDLVAEWVTVRTGLLRREHLLPVSGVETVAGRLVTRIDPKLIAAAPVAREHLRPTVDKRLKLLRHYDMDLDLLPAPSAMPQATFGGGTAGYVVVLDEAVGTELIRTLDNAVSRGPAQVHLVVPVNHANADAAAAARLEGDSGATDAGTTLAQWQLAAALRQLNDRGFAADGVITGEDPVTEVVQMVSADPGVDGVIVSTRSDTVSRWLGRDLPARIKRACPVPVVAVIVDDTPLAA